MAARTHSSGPLMHTIIKVVSVALFAAVLVLTVLVLYLSRNLPEGDIQNIEIPAAGLKFAFGSGHPEQDIVEVDGFDDGYALLSSGPVKLQAEQLPVLQYAWQPGGQAGELAFFWRQQGNTAEVKRTEVTATGNALLDLSAEPDWKGEIVEVGFLVAGDTSHPVTIGQLVLKPDSLIARLNLMWQDWTGYELRSQQSINFLQGGAHKQIVPLPLVVIVWLLLTLLLLRLLAAKMGIGASGSTTLTLAAALFLSAWMLLDIRWTVNSFRTAGELLSGATGTDPDHRSASDLDGELFKYIQRLKTDIIKHKADRNINRILVVGDENAIDYYLLRAKYHLLPDSAHVAGRFEVPLAPESLDYVIYFGQPESISGIPGWSAKWRQALVEVDRSEWGVVYQIQP